MAEWMLYDSTLGWLELTHENGILVEEFMPGVPEVRSVSDNRAGAHGTNDETRYYGNRSISISGKFKSTSSKTIDEVASSLKRYLLPNKRPVLRWTRDGVSRDIDVRVERAEQSVFFVVDDFNIEWIAPTPFWRSPDQVSEFIPFSQSLSLGGDPWPWLGGPSEVIDFGGGTVAIVPVTNPSEVEVYPIITVYGQVSGIILENKTNGKLFEIDASVNEDSGLVIDMHAHTVLLNGTANLFTSVNFDVTEWWPLEPGVVNEIIFRSLTTPVGSDDPFAMLSYYTLTT